jgi:hypothetical protein
VPGCSRADSVTLGNAEIALVRAIQWGDERVIQFLRTLKSDERPLPRSLLHAWGPARLGERIPNDYRYALEEVQASPARERPFFRRLERELEQVIHGSQLLDLETELGGLRRHLSETQDVYSLLSRMRSFREGNLAAGAATWAQWVSLVSALHEEAMRGGKVPDEVVQMLASFSPLQLAPRLQPPRFGPCGSWRAATSRRSTSPIWMAAQLSDGQAPCNLRRLA